MKVLQLTRTSMMKRGKKIVAMGSTNTDMVVAGKKIPVPGETISGGTFLMNPGGKGANQAVAIARLSAKRGVCMFIAKVGDDLFGRAPASRRQFRSAAKSVSKVSRLKSFPR